ncbi:hypothetical protein GQA12_14155 [Paenibacillus alvei]|nr:hypothetical protein [Paenibacillus alvei]
MNNEPWWTKMAYIAASAALTSIVAGSVTIGILLASSSTKPLLGSATETIVSEAHALHLHKNASTEIVEAQLLSPATKMNISLQTVSFTTLPTENQSKQIDDSVCYYLNQLAKEAPFQQWAHAETERFPLGPGMHGWFIRVMDKQKQIGYMILQSDEKGRIRLAEYGLGEQQPFDESTLKQALSTKQQLNTNTKGLTKSPRVTSIYPYQLAPLLTVWRVEWDNHSVDWLDAQSGEWLPLPKNYAPAPSVKGINSISSLQSQASINKSDLLESGDELYSFRLLSSNSFSLQTYRETASSSNYIAPFDPYENLKWIIKSTPVQTDLPLNYEEQKWVYVQRINSGLVNQPFSYIGIQKWLPAAARDDSPNSSSGNHPLPDNVYVIVGSQDKKSMRWLPSSAALQAGSFIPQS